MDGSLTGFIKIAANLAGALRMDVFRLIHAIGVHATSRWLQLAIATVCWLALFALISAKQTVAIDGDENRGLGPG